MRRLQRTFTLALVLAIFFFGAGHVMPAALADTPEFPIFDGYPKQGCYGYVVAGTGMWDGRGTITVDVPGPVVDAWLLWEGVNDTDDPGNPNTTVLEVNGQPIVGQMTDHTIYSTIHAEWYQWVADVGPTGYNLISQGTNTLDIFEWWPLDTYKDGTGTPDPRRNGVSLMVIYDRSPCSDPVEIVPFYGSDYVWWQGDPKFDGGPLTENHAFTFDPSPEDRRAHLVINFAGVSHTAPLAGICRDVSVWAAIGTGTPPDAIVQTGYPGSTGINGGTLVGENLFNISPPCTQSSAYPLVDFSGGFVGAEWSITDLVFDIPAGNEWLSVQLESVATGNPPVRPGGESGAWTGGIFLIPLPPPDVTLDKSDGLTSASPGDVITYTITFENAGPGLAQGVVITDTLPPRTTFEGCTTTLGTCSEAGGTVTIDVGDLPAGASGVAEITVRLDPVFPAGTTDLVNTAVISTITQGDDPLNNVAEDITTVTAVVELSLSKVDQPDPVDAGGVLTYTLNWSVGGNAYANDVVLTDTLPEKTSFTWATAPGTYDAANHQVVWNLGNLVPGNSGTVTVVVGVNTPLPNGLLLYNRAHLEDASGTTADTLSITTVRSDHQLSVGKDGPATANNNDEITYTISYAVTGNEPAPNARLVDRLPRHVTYVSSTGTYDPNNHTVTWNLGDLNTPVSGAVTLTVRIVDRVANGVVLTNVVTFADDDPGTPDVEASTETTVRSPYLPGTIGNLVWHDRNGNGVRDAGEPGIGGVTVDLYEDRNGNGAIDAGDIMVDRVTTDLFGEYTFDNVVMGDYLVTVSDVAGALAGMTKTSGTPGVDNNSQADPYAITLGNGETNLTADFGYTTGGLGGGGGVAIGDLVWRDENGNGVYEPAQGEVGIKGVTILATRDLNGNGVADLGEPTFGLLVTDDFGRYLYSDLPPDQYIIDVTDRDRVLTFYTLTTGNDPAVVDVSGGTDNLDVDFGYQPTGPGRIGDLVFYDANNNGTRDAGEPGIGSVRLHLFDPGADAACGGGDDTLLAAAWTTSDGVYTFFGLPAGSYCVHVDESVPALANFTLGATFSNPHGPITLGGGAAYLDADFGYISAIVVGTVFDDANGNGTQDSGEAGISGAGVCIYAAGNLTSPVACDSTDADGNYRFDMLAAGDYTVQLTGWPSGYEPTTPVQVNVTAPAGVETRADFGVAQPRFNLTKTFDVPVGAPIKVEVGDRITFTVRIENTGGVALASIPLRDTFDPAVLRFVSATPAPDSTTPAGTLTWNDLTGSGSLAPGASITVYVVFDAVAQTAATTNTATVSGATSAGGQTLPDASDSVTFGIQEPTAVTMASILAEFDGQGAVVLSWVTTAEFDNWGFNVYRAEVNDPTQAVRVNDSLIPGRGQSVSGATYRFVDESVEAGKTYWYWIEDVDLNGRTSWHGPVEVYVPQALDPGGSQAGRVFMPFILNR